MRTPLREVSIDANSLLKALHESTADLVPAAATSDADLQTARDLIATALARGQAEPLRAMPASGRADISATPPEDAARLLMSFAERAIAATEAPGEGEEAPLRVFRRERTLRTTQDALATPLWAAGQLIERTIGPFLSRFGEEVWFDVIRVVRRVLVRRGPGGPVVMAVPLRIGLVASTGQQFTLAAGSVWFSAPLAAGGAPASSYAGLRISGGTLDVGSPVTVVGHEIVIPAGAACTLTLTLDPQPATGPAARVAEDARAAAAATPATITLRFEPASLTLAAADRAMLRAYDQQVDLSFQPGPATFEPAINRLMFPFEPQLRRFVIGVPRSKTFIPEGRARIEGADWALPVATGDPASLGEAAGTGGLAVRLGAGLSAAWSTLEGGPARLGPTLLMAEPGRLVMVALQARLANGRQRLRLGGAPGVVGRLDLAYGTTAPVRYFAEAGLSEAVLTVCGISASLDRPLTVDGARVPLRGTGFLSWIERRETQLLYRGLGSLTSRPEQRLGFALANAVLFSGAPGVLGLVGEIEGQALTTGKAAILSGFFRLLPTLPDPYASNARGGVNRSDAPVGVLGVLLDWAAPDREPRLDFFLPPTAWLGLHGEVRQVPTSAPAAPYVELPHGVARPRIPVPDKTANEDAERLVALGHLMNRWTGPVGDLTLLDVSTNADLFGVRYGFFAGRQTHLASVPAVAAPIVDAMHLQVPGRTLRVVTTPPVSWEAVFTRELVQSATGPVYFPSPLTFPDAGGPTSLGVETVALVRAAPNPAIDSFVDTLGPHRERGGISFTLPYGIVAAARVPDPSAPDRPDVSLLRPEFPTADARGARQISVRARGNPPLSEGTPGLPGAAIILRNARGPFAPTGGMSVLSDVVAPSAGPDATFNDNFAPGRPRAKVPVVRIDFTGYGESLFSDWRNPEDAAAVVSQARFDVIVGRTAHEVIQIRSILYPYAARLVRTITIQRENRGVTVRHDSGWKHVSGGRFDFPTTTVAPAPVTHPGVVRGATRIVNIRQMTDTARLSDGTLLAAVMFDCHIDIEGVVAGGTPEGVISRGQVGYIQMTDPSSLGQLSAALYAELLQQKGALGGPVDCTAEVGRIGSVAGSGLAMRVTRAAVDRTMGGGPQEFAAAAWGSPALPAGGSWSMVRQAATDETPVAVPRDSGTPLVRRGPASVPSTVNPEAYRFADPADVLNAGSPLAEYGILFATPAHRILFRRPKVERGDSAVTSAVHAVLADNYARAASTGLFPASAQWTLLLGPAWRLAVLTGGHLRLELPAGPPVTVTNPVRAFSNSPTLRTRIEYRDRGGPPSNFSLVVDSSQPVRWSYGVDRVSHVNEAGNLGEVITLVSGISAADGAPYRMPDPKMLLGGCFAPVQSAMDLLAMLGFPNPLEVAVTNSKLELEARLNIPLGPPPKHEIDLVVMLIKDAAISVGFGFGWDICVAGGPAVKATFEAGAVAIIATPYSTWALDLEVPGTRTLKGLVAIGLFKITIAMASDNPEVVTLRVGAGIGVEFEVLGFGATAYFASFIEIIAGGNVFGLMFGVILTGEIDLGVVSASMTLEARMGLIRRECPPVTSVWGLLQASVAIEVSIFAVIDISFTWEYESKVLFSGESSCEIPETV